MNEQEARDLYALAIATNYQEAQAIWTRFSFMVVVNAILLAGAFGGIAENSGPPAWVLGIAGFTISGGWGVLSLSTLRSSTFWLERAVELEQKGHVPVDWVQQFMRGYASVEPGTGSLKRLLRLRTRARTWAALITGTLMSLNVSVIVRAFF